MDREFIDDRVHIVDRGTTAVVHDVVKGRYCEIPTGHLPPLPWAPVRAILPRPSMAATLAILAGSTLFCILWASRPPASPSTGAMGPLLVMPFLILQIALHEYAHVAALAGCGKKPDKIGVKLNYRVFPAVFVRMNTSLLLARQDQIVVHLAGVTANSAVCACIILLQGVSPSLDVWTLALATFIPMLALNLAPILNSDGQKTLMAVLGVAQRRHWKEGRPWEHAIRAASVGFILCALLRLVLVLKEYVHV